MARVSSSHCSLLDVSCRPISAKSYAKQSWGLPSQYSLIDNLTLDPSYLSTVPRPVLAVTQSFFSSHGKNTI